MKILLIYRSKKHQAHSIENVFDTLYDEFKQEKDLQVYKYFAEGSLRKIIKEIKTFKDIDVYHITGSIHYLSFFLPRSKTTLTIHDIGIYKNHPKSLKKYLIALVWFILPIFYLKKVVVISELVKKDLSDYFGINTKNIVVIDNPLTINVIHREFNKKISNKTQILQIGSTPNKNLLGLINAVTNIKDDYHITIIGKPEKYLIEILSKSEISYIIKFNISQSELIEAYLNCDFVYFASTSEGFGLPILEGQYLKRPVITSNISPMKDIGGDGVLLVDPFDHLDIQKGILNLTNNEELKKTMVKNGIVNVNKYLPHSIAQKYLFFFKSVNKKL